MVCMKSRIGVRNVLTRSLVPAHTPSGMPMHSEKQTAVSVSARVSMLGCHSPCRPMKKNPADGEQRRPASCPSAHEM